jgi:hypothetical protein
MYLASAPDLTHWTTELETDPVWTDRLRQTLRAVTCPPADLAVLIGAAEDFPRAAERAARVRGYVVSVGRLSDVLAELPRATCATMNAAERRKYPELCHAIILAMPYWAEPIRFRVPLLAAG